MQAQTLNYRKMSWVSLDTLFRWESQGMDVSCFLEMSAPYFYRRGVFMSQDIMEIAKKLKLPIPKELPVRYPDENTDFELHKRLIIERMIQGNRQTSLEDVKTSLRGIEDRLSAMEAAMEGMSGDITDTKAEVQHIKESTEVVATVFRSMQEMWAGKKSSSQRSGVWEAPASEGTV